METNDKINDSNGAAKSNSNTNVNVETVKYSKIKSLLNTLDKFLARKFVLVLGIYFSIMAICGAGLFVNNSLISNASSGDGASKSADMSVNAWLYSSMALCTFLMLLGVVYLVTRKKHKKV